MNFKEQFPSIKKLAEMYIVESPFTKGKKSIACPYTESGQWMHKEDLSKYCRDNQRIKEAIEKVRKNEWTDGYPWYLYLEEELNLK